jgi:photosystem II stability/assembly factor-like uncharacterized protein
MTMISTETFRPGSKATIIRSIVTLCCAIAISAAAAFAQSWQPSGLSGKDVRDIERSSAGVLIAATSGGVYLSGDNGGSWSATSLTASASLVASGNDGWLYVVSAGGFSRSSDGGGSWTTTAQSEIQEKFGIMKALAVDDMGRVFTGTNDAIWRSSDHGANWTELPGTGLPESFPDINVIEAGGSGELLAASWGIVGGDLYGSGDGGSTWIKVYDGTMGNDVVGVGIAPSGDYFIAPSGENMILRSTDEGGSWMEITSHPDFTQGWVSSFLFTPAAYYALAGSLGIFRSTDGGMSWSSFNDGLPASTTTQRAVVASNGEVILGTKKGIYRLSSVAGVPDEGRATSLRSDARPNPALDRVTILYRLAEPSMVSFTLVDPLGRTVVSKETQEEEGGEHRIELGVAGLPAGTYLYRITAGATVDVGRVIVR